MSYALAAYGLVIGALGAYALHLAREIRTLGERESQNVVDKRGAREV